MFHKSFEFHFILLLLSAVMILAWSCKPSKSQKRTIIVSILPQKYIVKQIVGDKYEVEVLVPNGISPESYDPTPRNLVTVSESDLYFMVGNFGFEKPWLPRIQEVNPSMHICNMSDSTLSLKYDNHHGVDPHVWMNPNNMKLMAQEVCKVLSVYDPEHIEFYKTNLNAFLGRMDNLHDRIRKLMNISSTKTFVIYHPALTYFADLYGLKQLSIEHDHKEPSAASIAHLMEEIKCSQTKILFIQQEIDVRLAETFARECGLRVVTINPLSEDYEEELMRIALAIAK